MLQLEERAGDFSRQAEFDLTGCILLYPQEVLETIRGIVSVSDFETETAREIFTAACQLDNEKAPIDVVLIQERAAENGAQIDDEILANIMKTCMTPANAAATANVVHEAALEREKESIGFQLTHGELSANEAFIKLSEILSGGNTQLSTPLEDANRFMDTIDKSARGLCSLYQSTGFRTLDGYLGGGLINSGLITLAARPGVGKTTMGLAIAENVAKSGAKVLYESLEMSRIQLWARRNARLSGISFTRIQGARDLNSDEWAKIVDATDMLSRRPFTISDRPARIDEIEKRAIRFKPDLLVIDHGGLIRPEKPTGSKYADMTEISHRLKGLAQILEKPILNMCQLNRSSETRSDKRPSLADLRDTGAWEEDSDAVILLHRPAYYITDEDEENEKPKDWDMQDMDVILAKNRHGMTGTIKMNFVGANAMILEQSRRHED